MPELNEDQSEVADKAVQFYNDPGKNFFILHGWAGVGKTFTIQRIIRRLQDQHPSMQISLTAPTNAATNILREMATEFGLKGILCTTIYKSMGLVLDNNGEEKHTKRLVNGNFEEMDLVVVDEGSMLSKYLTKMLKDRAITNNVKVIIMGDRYQLPPVKEPESPVFSEADVYTELTKSMRQENGNPILEIVTSLRLDVMNKTDRTEYKNSYSEKLDKGIWVMGPKDWYDSVRENFVSEEYKSDPNLFRCLAWTNKRVNALNRSIRRLLVGETDSPFVPGERALTRQPIFDDLTQAKPEVILNTNEECEVFDIYQTTHPLYDGMSEEYKVWAITLLTDSKVSAVCYLLHEDGKQAYESTLKKLLKAAKENASQWRHFWNFKDSFADLQPPHALTIHRSQGSTYKNVFLDVYDCNKNPKHGERRQLKYVGASRASDNLLILSK